MKLFITYEYFTPAYKAGGPIQSIDNLVANYTNAQIYVYCSNTDLDGSILQGVKHDEWVLYNNHTKVFYASGTKDISANDLLTEIEPDIIFTNGLFSPAFTLKPLLWSGEAKKIVSARGMLHPGALSQKRLKKKTFLTLFKLLGIHKHCTFHATTQEEAGYIKNTFGKNAKVWVASNFPKAVHKTEPLHKNIGQLQLVSVAIVSPMKNIKLILQALLSCTSKINYDIYGPIKDNTYWEECKEIMKLLPGNVKANYHGAVAPDKIMNILALNHCFILPSKSENFGHAIYEALASGTPVITSMYTPWNCLEEAKAGYNVQIENVETITDAIEMIASVDNDEYIARSNAAATFAEQKINIAAIKKEYEAMFLGS